MTERDESRTRNYVHLTLALALYRLRSCGEVKNPNEGSLETVIISRLEFLTSCLEELRHRELVSVIRQYPASLKPHNHVFAVRFADPVVPNVMFMLVS